MKVVKKMFYIFLAVAFFLQSCAFSYVSAQAVGNNYVGGDGKELGFLWNSSVKSTDLCRGTGIKDVKVVQDGEKLRWTIELENDDFSISRKTFFGDHYAKSLSFSVNDFIDVSYGNKPRRIENFQYTATIDGKPYSVKGNNQTISVNQKPSISIEDQKISFTTIKDELSYLKKMTISFSFDRNFALSGENLKKINLDITPEEAKPEPEKNGKVLLFLKSEESDKNFPKELNVQITKENKTTNPMKLKIGPNGEAIFDLPFGDYSIEIMDTDPKGYVFNNTVEEFSINESSPQPRVYFDFKLPKTSGEEEIEKGNTESDLSGHNPFPYLYTYSPEMYLERDCKNLYVPWENSGNDNYKNVYKNDKDKPGDSSNLEEWLTKLNKEQGTYPIGYSNPKNFQKNASNENIRNVNTKNVPGNEVNSKAKTTQEDNDKKLEYNNSILGKWAESTEEDDEYYVNLTIEGKQYIKPKGIDIVFALDNSHSMVQNFKNEPFQKVNKHQALVPYGDTKIASLYNNMVHIVRSLLNEKNYDIRVGITNFSTLTVPVEWAIYGRGESNNVSYPGGFKKLKEDILNALEKSYEDTPLKGTVENITKNQQYLMDYYSVGTREVFNVPLTKDKGKILSRVPIIPRGSGYINSRSGYYDGANMWANFDGLTNIAAGIHDGVELLYPKTDSSGRKKVLVIVSDGIPTSSFRLKNLNASGEFTSNLYPIAGNIASFIDTQYYDTNFKKDDVDKDLLISSLITTNSVPYLSEYGIKNKGASSDKFSIYKTSRGEKVFNNLQGTTAVRDYYLKKHSDMRIMGLLIGALNLGEFGEVGSDFYSCGTNADTGIPSYRGLGNININEAVGNGQNGDSSTYPNPYEYLKSLTTQGLYGRDFFLARDSQKLTNSLTEIGNEIIKTIVNGTAVDPIGEQYTLALNQAEEFIPQKPVDNFKSGYSLEDDFGNYIMLNKNSKTPLYGEKDAPEYFSVFDKTGKYYMNIDGTVFRISDDEIVNENENEPLNIKNLRKSYLRGVSVQLKSPKKGTNDHGTILINHLYLGIGDQIHLKYRVRLIHDSNNPKDKAYANNIKNYKSNTFFQMNKETYLVPQINGNDALNLNEVNMYKKEAFPLPSARLFKQESELPSTGGISFGASSIALITMGMMVCYYVYIKNIKRT